jgi:hypothetical protein
VFILVVWGMMNVKKELPKIKEMGPSAGCSGCAAEKVAPQPQQADVIMRPGMFDAPFEDTGLQLESLDLNPM